MRKLKFRAWNKKYKEMFSWERLLELNENNTKEGPNKTIHHEHMSLFQMILTNNDIGDRYELMQSTGLFDKNGKEIYEGDILGRNYLGEMQVEGIIAYDKDLSRIVFNQVNGAFEEINKAELNLLEVIGNVYENQELIDR